MQPISSMLSFVVGPFVPLNVAGSELALPADVPSPITATFTSFVVPLYASLKLILAALVDLFPTIALMR
jgi:hypothetical protein